MSDFKQRLIQEHTELKDKLLKLCDFFETATFKGLCLIDQALLKEQSVYMGDYLVVLTKRIARL